jgi:putative oxidoreductase
MGVIYTMGGGNWFNAEGAALFFQLFAIFCFAGPGRYSLDYLLFDRKAEQAVKIENPAVRSGISA